MNKPNPTIRVAFFDGRGFIKEFERVLCGLKPCDTREGSWARRLISMFNNMSTRPYPLEKESQYKCIARFDLIQPKLSFGVRVTLTLDTSVIAGDVDEAIATLHWKLSHATTGDCFNSGTYAIDGSETIRECVFGWLGDDDVEYAIEKMQ